MSGDPNAPVEALGQCGSCRHFARYRPLPPEQGGVTIADHPRAARFGTCTRWHDVVVHGSSPEKDPADRGPVDATVGDEFGCLFWSGW